jgi:hypothetical protein
MKKLIKRYVSVRFLNVLRGYYFIIRMRHRYNYWMSIRPRLKRPLANNHAPKCNASGLKVLIPLIETNHYQYLQILVVAKVLQLRGAQVKVVLCGQALDGCEIKSVRTEHDQDPCWTCRYNEHNVVPLFGLETVLLKEILAGDELYEIDTEISQVNSSGQKAIVKGGINLTQCIEDSIVRYFYGGLPNDPLVQNKVWLAHAKTAIISAHVAKRIDQTWAPDIVFNNMGGYSTWEPYCRYFERHGNRFSTVSVTAYDYNCVRFNLPNLLQSSLRFQRYIETRDQQKLTEKERSTLIQFLEKRFSGQSQIFRDMGAFHASASGSRSIRTRLGYRPDKRNVFIFPNVHWDVGLSDNGALYSNVIDWVLDTIELSKRLDNCHVYIKPHPAEVFGISSIKGISHFIKEKYPVLPSNITVIEPEWMLKPYDLFEFIDLGVIFTGTLGLEMMLSHIPVVSTGLTSYKGLGFASEPESRDEYFKVLNGDIKLPPFDRDVVELFAYFYFIRTLIPWVLTKQAYDDNFDGFTFKSLDDLKPGKNPHLDHLCNCILDPVNTVPEAWLEQSIT